MKKNLLKTCVWSIALYGSETWTIDKTEQRRLLDFETRCYRISWIEHITNEKVYRKGRRSVETHTTA